MGTWNVQAKLQRDEVFKFCITQSLDVVALQDIALDAEQTRQFKNAGPAFGYRISCTLPGTDAAGNPYAGCALMVGTRLRAHFVDNPPGLPRDRVQFVQVMRPERSLLVAGTYWKPSWTDQDKRDVLTGIRNFAALADMDVVIIGDWNTTHGEHPISEFIASESLYALNSADEIAIPTRSAANARHIDYAVSSGYLMRSGYWNIKVGVEVSDHHQIVYEFQLQDYARRSQPQRLKLSTRHLTEAEWEDAFDSSLQLYLDLCDRGCWHEAYDVLSGAAEEALAVPDAPRIAVVPRSVIGRCTNAPVGGFGTNASLPIVGRRLANWRRARVGFAKSPSLAAQMRLQRNAAALSRRFTEMQLTGDLQRDLDVCDAYLQGVIERSSAARCAKWQWSMDNSDSAAAAWVRRKDDEGPSILARNSSPDDELRESTAVFSDIWTSEGGPEADALHSAGYTDWIPAEGYPGGRDWSLTGESMMKKCRSNAKSGSGPDGWAPVLLAALPLGFWSRLASLIKAMIRGRSGPPAAWCFARVAMLRKDDGGWRPISVASALWRVSSSCVLRSMSVWVQSWAPEALQGGLPGRGLELVHHKLAADMAQHQLCGFKVDLSKCFDRASAAAALDMMRRLGLDDDLVEWLSAFYRELRSCFRNKYTTLEYVRRRLGLLQGCPWSMVLIAALMMPLVRMLERLSPACSFNVYCDDRLFHWRCDGANSLNLMLQAAALVKRFDDTLHWIWNHNKGMCFDMSGHNLAPLEAMVGASSSIFVNLGITYDTAAINDGLRPEVDDLLAELRRRLVRIRAAASTSGRRRRLVAMMALSLLRFAAAWRRLDERAARAVALDVERCVLSGKTWLGRSPALAWCALIDIRMHPLYIILAETLAAKGRSIRRDLGRSEPWPRAPDNCPWALDLLGWVQVDEGVYDTPDGRLVLGRDGPAATRRAITKGLQLHLLSKDSRGHVRQPNNPDAAQRPLVNANPRITYREYEPFFGAHKKWVQDADYLTKCVALGNSPDARTMRAAGIADPRCICGVEAPTRRHLAWGCTAQSSLRLAPPRCEVEEGLIVPLVKRAGKSLPDVCPDEDLRVARIADLLSQCDGCCCAACDGGSDKIASVWGVAVRLPDGSVGKVGGPVTRLDSSSYAAELFALLQLLRAAARSATDLRLVIDNAAVAAFFALVCCGKAWLPKQYYADWREAQQLCVGRAHRVWWIPSHGRVEGWRPTGVQAMWGSAEFWRELNRCADEACNSALIVEARRRRTSMFRAEVRRAERWAAGAFERLRTRTRLLISTDIRIATKYPFFG